MAQSSVISQDTMPASSSSSSGTHSVSPFTMNGNRERNQMVTDYCISPSFRPWHYSSSLLLSSSSPTDDVGADRTNDIDEQPELTTSPDSRHTRSPAVLPVTIPTSHPQTDAAIPASNNSYINQSRQDDRTLVNSSASHSKNSSTAHGYNVFPSPPHSAFTNPFHGSINNSNNSPTRTSNQVFSSPQDLAAHYGIPQILPPAPRPTPRPNRPQPFRDFQSLSSNYLTMLSQKPTDHSMAEDAPPTITTVSPADLLAPAQTPEHTVDYQGIIDVLTASPEFHSSPHAFNASPEYLTSPFMPSPLDDFNDTSPYDDSPYSESLLTPVVTDSYELDMDDMYSSPLVGYGDGLQLFGDMALFPPCKPAEPPVLDTVKEMYTMSPETPLLDFVDPNSLYSPHLPADESSFSTPPLPLTRRKSTATGTRKNITPESLVPLDAPTQPRKYLTPSATSRKDVPAVFAKKRGRSQAFGDEEDELAEEPLPPNATEKEQIEWKRRQNTLAARKSRKRKLEYQRQLEEDNEILRTRAEVWKTRALTMQQMLQSHGVPSAEFTD